MWGSLCVGRSRTHRSLMPFKDLLCKGPSVLGRTLAGFHVALKPGMLLLRGGNPGRWLMMTMGAKAASVPSRLVLFGFTAGLWEPSKPQTHSHGKPVSLEGRGPHCGPGEVLWPSCVSLGLPVCSLGMVLPTFPGTLQHTGETVQREHLERCGCYIRRAVGRTESREGSGPCEGSIEKAKMGSAPSGGCSGGGSAATATAQGRRREKHDCPTSHEH